MCVEATNYTGIVDNQITIECPTVMRGRYVTFIRNPGGQDIDRATLCEVVVMGRRVVSRYLKHDLICVIYTIGCCLPQAVTLFTVLVSVIHTLAVISVRTVHVYLIVLGVRLSC